ncbi:MAG: hypothetical protein SF162_11050 [bacterium]|nr:hypothetical protein [bacterium]
MLNITVEWLKQDRVIYQRFVGRVTLEGMRQVQPLFAAMLDHGTAPVHAVIDLREVTDYPRNLRRLSEVMMMRNSPHLGFVLVMTSNVLLRFVTTVLTQTFARRMNVHWLDDEDSVIAFLRKHDDTLQHIEWSLARHSVEV